MNYNQFSLEERHTIDILLNIKKITITNIAKVLGRNKSSISREIRRNSVNDIYFYQTAHKQSQERSKHKYYFRQLKYLEFSLLFKKYYDPYYHGVKATWVKIINENSHLKSISWVWIFKLIKSNRWIIKRHQRLRQFYKKGRKRKIGIFNKFKNKRIKPIWTRAKKIDLRDEEGHYEIDLIVGKKANGYANLLTLSERKTRLMSVKLGLIILRRFIVKIQWKLIVRFTN